MQLGKAKAWIREEIGGAIESIRQLPGSTSSFVYEVKAATESLVLRQFNNKEWLLEEPDLVQHEVTSLQTALQIELQTPDILAFDETGDRAGMPSLLMTKIAGRVELSPDDFGNWTDELAKALVTVHRLQANDFSWKYAPYMDVKKCPFLHGHRFRIYGAGQSKLYASHRRHLLKVSFTATITQQMYYGKMVK